MKKPPLQNINHSIIQCTRCPELRNYCAQVGIEKRKSYMDWDYHAKPVPGFGDQNAWLWIVGLAPAAHGANRTGRMFTGDRSGDFLFAGLHRNGLANQPIAVSADDGLELKGVYISAALRCAPPANKPTNQQLSNCSAYLTDEYHALKKLKVIMALGGIAWNSAIQMLNQMGYIIPTPKPKFSHCAVMKQEGISLIGCYHVSQQNTFTGRLTPEMFDQAITQARDLA